MGASRFPGKPMALINGFPMIGHVYHRALSSKKLDDLYVATCDQIIFDFIQSIGGKACMTSPAHTRATDRCAECLEYLEKKIQSKINIAVMIQGDEPMINGEMIDSALEPIISGEAEVSNLCAALYEQEEVDDPNEIKVVFSKDKNALYFSRKAIPHKPLGPKILSYKQICIIPFTREALIKFNSLESTPLEISESIDMLRFLENGIPVKMVETIHNSYSVDTPEDLSFVEEQFINHPTQMPCIDQISLDKLNI